MDATSQKLLCDFFVRALHEKFPEMPVTDCALVDNMRNGMDNITGSKRRRESSDQDSDV